MIQGLSRPIRTARRGIASSAAAFLFLLSGAAFAQTVTHTTADGIQVTTSQNGTNMTTTVRYPGGQEFVTQTMVTGTTGASIRFSGTTPGGPISGDVTYQFLGSNSLRYTGTVNGVAIDCTITNGTLSGTCGALNTALNPASAGAGTPPTTGGPTGPTDPSTPVVTPVGDPGHGGVPAPAFQNSIAATDEVITRTIATRIAGTISNRVAQAVRQASRQARTRTTLGGADIVKGLSGGDGDGGTFATWGSASVIRLRQGGAGTNFDGNLSNFMLGADYSFDKAVVGLSAGYNGANVRTKYNNGKLQSDAFTVAAYGGYAITDFLNADVNLGYSRTGKDTRRSGGLITGDTDSNRWFGSANLVAHHAIDAFELEGRIGYTYAAERTDGFLESNGARVDADTTRVGTLTVGARVGYGIGGFVPYVTGAFLYDTIQDSGGVTAGQNAVLNDRSAFELGAGVDYLSGNFVFTAEVLTEVARRDFNSVSGMLSARYRF